MWIAHWFSVKNQSDWRHICQVGLQQVGEAVVWGAYVWLPVFHTFFSFLFQHSKRQEEAGISVVMRGNAQDTAVHVLLVFISRTQLSMFSWCLFPKHSCPRSLCVYFLNTAVYVLFVFISKTQPSTVSLCVFPKHNHPCSLGVYFQVLPGVWIMRTTWKSWVMRWAVLMRTRKSPWRRGAAESWLVSDWGNGWPGQKPSHRVPLAGWKRWIKGNLVSLLTGQSWQKLSCKILLDGWKTGVKGNHWFVCPSEPQFQGRDNDTECH